MTVEHFKEIVRFQEWLESLEYPIVPGVPAKMPYKNPPKTLTWPDMCEKFKSDDTIKVWPHGTPDECRLIPSQCPQIRPITRSRCRTYGQSPLDFVYEKKFQDYNFRKFSSDERLLQKVRTGKGDETVDSYDDLGNVIYVQFMFGST